MNETLRVALREARRDLAEPVATYGVIQALTFCRPLLLVDVHSGRPRTAGDDGNPTALPVFSEAGEPATPELLSVDGAWLVESAAASTEIEELAVDPDRPHGIRLERAGLRAWHTAAEEPYAGALQLVVRALQRGDDPEAAVAVGDALLASQVVIPATADGRMALFVAEGRRIFEAYTGGDVFAQARGEAPWLLTVGSEAVRAARAAGAEAVLIDGHALQPLATDADRTWVVPA